MVGENDVASVLPRPNFDSYKRMATTTDDSQDRADAQAIENRSTATAVEMNDLEKSPADVGTSSSLPHTEVLEANLGSSTRQEEATAPSTAPQVQDSGASNFMSETSSEPPSTTLPGIEGTASVSDASQLTSTRTYTRKDSIAIGPATDVSHSPVVDASNPVCIITLLLTSGARHPYKLDEKYLVKRNVDVPGILENGRKDPFSISVYTLKELILREWRDEWEAQPSSPSSIRLIHFGRLLDDKTPLKGTYPAHPTTGQSQANRNVF